MSLFGESDTDRRDFAMGLAGFLGGVHALRILAERGIASPDDIQLSVDGMKAVLAQVPEGQLQPGQREQLDSMLNQLVSAAVINFGSKS